MKNYSLIKTAVFGVIADYLAHRLSQSAVEVDEPFAFDEDWRCEITIDGVLYALTLERV